MTDCTPTQARELSERLDDLDLTGGREGAHALRSLANHSDTRTWQAYQCGIADADRAQRAAPGVKPRLIGWRTSDFLMETADKAKAENWQVHHEIQPIFEGDPHTSLKPPEVQAAPYAQLSDQSVVMVVAFDEGVKEPRIVSWNKFTVGKHRLYAAQPPQQSAQPVAWMHETPGRVDVIHDEVKKLLSAVATDYLYRPIDKSEKYTIPLYAAAQPVEVQPLTPAEQDAADWIYRLNAPDRYADRVAAFCAWMGRNGIKPTSSEGGAA